VREPSYKIDIYPFGESSLASLLGFKKPPFAPDAFRQLTYIEDYLKEEGCVCKSVLIERHYIDRDYMEDHSVFYSRNLYPYSNWCQRVHFFSLDPKEVKRRLTGIVQIGIEQNLDKYLEACGKFSDNFYLGFSVIKPLVGCPVGRTVLRQYKEDAGNGLRRQFTCTREYKTHLLGVELSVHGLAFQQQDIGVSACATTALWVALQKARDFEDIASATPAQITRLASQYTLPFGRSMPSEGLSLDQMSQAVQAIGISPNLLRVKDFETARGFVYSACKSGFAQVLILQSPYDDSEFHAITVVGMKTQSSNEHLRNTILIDRAADLKAVYVHDDRIGPYLRADFVGMGHDARLEVGYGIGTNRKIQQWKLTHVLMPMHGKIRLSFDEIRSVARNIANRIEAFRKLFHPELEAQDHTIAFETLILRSPLYIRSLIFGPKKILTKKLNAIREKLSLSRYVGVVHLESSYFGSLDILVDTTSTPKNINCLKVIVTEQASNLTIELAKFLSREYGCSYIV
jgi:hypothetical protein